jgi:uncharacterized delta-60 repeat protein
MSIARRAAACILSILASATMLPAGAASGDLDATFGDGGVAAIPQPFAAGLPDAPRAIVRQSTGKLVIVGNDSIVARLAADGTLDTTFGTSGRTLLRDSLATAFVTQAAAVTASDQVLVLGDSTGAYSVLYRLGADGTPDAAFGIGGRRVVDTSAAGHSASSFSRIVVQPDGKLVLGGTDGATQLVARLNADGTLDAAFGTGGVTASGAGNVAALALYGDGRIAYGTGNRIFRLTASGAVDATLPAGTSLVLPAGAWIRQLAVQLDGKILAEYSDFFQSASTLIRYTTTGELDQDATTGFGAPLSGFRAGSVSSPIRSPVIVATASRILLAGYVAQVDFNQSLTQNQAAAALLTLDGTLDGAFGTGGVVVSTLGNNSSSFGGGDGGYASWQSAAAGSWGAAILGERDGDLRAFQADAAGVALAGFGTAGMAALDLGKQERHRVRAIARQSDGKLLVAGCRETASGCDALVYRLDPGGTVDPTFGTGGRFTADFGGDDAINGLAIQADGRILLAGRATDGTGSLFLMARLTALGALDPAFNGGGTHLLRFEGASSDEAVGVGIQSSGKIIFGGTTTRSSGTDFAAVRLAADGTLDSSFGSAGRRLVDSGSGVADIARAMAVISGDRIVIAGSSGFDISNVNFASGAASVLVLTADGTPDISFGAAGGIPGWRMGHFGFIGSAAEEVLGIAEMPDGRLKVVGAYMRRTGGGPNVNMFYPFAWSSDLETGAQDSFPVYQSPSSTPSGEGRLRGVAVQADGRWLVGGEEIYTAFGPDGSGIVEYSDGVAGRLDSGGGNWTAVRDFEDGSDDRGGLALALPDGKAVHAYTVNDRAIVLTRREGILRESPTVSLSVSPADSVFGQPVTATVTVTGVTRRPTGSIGFYSHLSCYEPLPPGEGLVVTVTCPAQALVVAGPATLKAYYMPDTADLAGGGSNEVAVNVSDVAASAAVIGVKVRGVATNQLPQPFFAEVEIEARDAGGNPVRVGNTYEVTLQKVSGAGNLEFFYPSACYLQPSFSGNGPSRCTLALRWDTVEDGVQLRAVATSLTALPSLPPTAPFTIDVVPYATSATAFVAGPATLVAGTAATFELWLAPDGQSTLTAPEGTVDFRLGGVPVAGCQGLAWAYGYSTEVPGGNYRAQCTTVQTTVAAPATTFEAVYSGGGGFQAATVSKPLVVSAAASASLELVSGSGQSTALGGSLALPLRARVRDAFGNAAAARLVTYVAPASGASVLLLNGGQASTGADGIAAIGGIAAGGAGAFTVVASTAGVAGTVVFSLTNAAPAPAVFLASGNNPSVLGAPVPLTATVVTSGGPVPTGTVTFLNGAASLGTGTLSPSGSGASATLVVPSLPVGAYTLTARYEGDASWAAATSGPVAQTVNPAAAGVSVSSSANPSTFGASVTFTATVGGTSPTGTVQFHDGTNALGSPVALAGGQASLTLATLGVGLHAVTATYSGDANHQASTSLPAIQVVNRAAPAFSIASNLDAAPAGASVTFSVALASPAAVPTGFVVFRNAGVEFAAAPVVNGVATLTTASLPAGTNAIRAEYSGDGNFEPSLSATIAIPIGPLDPAGDADRDAIPNGVEAAEGRNPLAKDNDLFSPGAGSARLFAMQQYRDFLNREGDEPGIAGWASLVDSGAFTRPQVIDAFVQSPEFGGFVAPVVRLYFATFLRVPDYAGLVYNAGLVRAGTVTPVQLADFFAASPEFAATYGALDDTQFVTLLYANVLGRAPDPAGLAGWVALLEGGMSRGQVLYGFSESAEYQANMASKVLVTMMYAGMLRRTPEPDGFNGWVAYLDAGAYTREQVINGFFLSAEYHARFLP